MKYALLIYEAPGSLEALPKGQYEAMFAEYMALSNKSRFLNGARLQPVETAKTVRVRDGQTLTTDGPFADTRRCSAASASSRWMTSTRRSRWRRGSRRGGSAGPSSFGRWRSASSTGRGFPRRSRSPRSATATEACAAVERLTRAVEIRQMILSHRFLRHRHSRVCR
jgi:hypothetical protein